MFLTLLRPRFVPFCHMGSLLQMLHRNVEGSKFTVNQYAAYVEGAGKWPSGRLESANFRHYVGASLPFWGVNSLAVAESCGIICTLFFI
jgi:hypothetical protein